MVSLVLRRYKLISITSWHFLSFQTQTKKQLFQPQFSNLTLFPSRIRSTHPPILKNYIRIVYWYLSFYHTYRLRTFILTSTPPQRTVHKPTALFQNSVTALSEHFKWKVKITMYRRPTQIPSRIIKTKQMVGARAI